MKAYEIAEPKGIDSLELVERTNPHPAPTEVLVRVRDYMNFEEAAALPCAAVTSWNALVSLGRVTAGESVLVMGTGGVSIFALQFARIHGARVIATSSSDTKLARLTEMGASGVIN